MGPLDGIRVVELSGLGPAPFAAMALADLGADVIRVARPGQGGDGATGRFDVLNRNRDCVELDLKDPDRRHDLLRLIDDADVFVEGFRPGVCERLGLGPDDLLSRNEGLVYGRMTGWGQTGPLAHSAGHDITYAATAGAIAHIGRHGAPPTPPLNLVADFGGGGMLLAMGILAAVVSARSTGQGQVVDAAMVDGVAMLMGALIGATESGFWDEERGTNLLDSGAPYYDCYRCADGGYVAVGAIEAPFYAALLDGLGLTDTGLPDQNDRAGWPRLRAAFEDAFAERARDEWAERFEGSDACVAPVVPMGELADHPHLRARDTIIQVDGASQPAPAPRFSATPSGPPRVAAAPVAVSSVLARWRGRSD